MVLQGRVVHQRPGNWHVSIGGDPRDGLLDLARDGGHRTACGQQGEIAAYRFRRVIRIESAVVGEFFEASRVEPGTLKHLYPDSKDAEANDVGDA